MDSELNVTDAGMQGSTEEKADIPEESQKAAQLDFVFCFEV